MFLSTLSFISFWKPHKPSQDHCVSTAANQPLSPLPPEFSNTRTLKAVAVTLLDWSESKRVVPSWWVVSQWWLWYTTRVMAPPVAVLCHVMVGITTEVKSNCFTVSPFQKCTVYSWTTLLTCVSSDCFDLFRDVHEFPLSSTVFYPAASVTKKNQLRHLLLMLCSISKVRFGCVSKEILHLAESRIQRLGKFIPKDPPKECPGPWFRVSEVNLYGSGCLGV